jgi:phage-related protein
VVTVKPKKVQAVFYRNINGLEPVKRWLKDELRKVDRRIVGTDIGTVERGWPVGMPLCRNLGNGLWEVRSDIEDGIARVIFFFHESELVLLHGFVKKTQKTPQSEIKLALGRKKEIERRGA